MARSSDGRCYRLDQASLDMWGSSGEFSFDVGGDEEVVVDLPVGDYDVLLRDGWRMLEVADDGSETEVATVFLGPNPQAVVVEEGRASDLTLRFSVDGEAVPFGHGRLNGTIDNTEKPAAEGLLVRVDEPAKASSSVDGAVPTSGAVSGGSDLSLVVDGRDESLGADGSFSTTLDLASGLHVIEYVARRRGGGPEDEVRTARSVLVGPFREPFEAVQEAWTVILPTDSAMLSGLADVYAEALPESVLPPPGTELTTVRSGCTPTFGSEICVLRARVRAGPSSANVERSSVGVSGSGDLRLTRQVNVQATLPADGAMGGIRFAGDLAVTLGFEESVIVRADLGPEANTFTVVTQSSSVTVFDVNGPPGVVDDLVDLVVNFVRASLTARIEEALQEPLGTLPTELEGVVRSAGFEQTIPLLSGELLDLRNRVASFAAVTDGSGVALTYHASAELRGASDPGQVVNLDDSVAVSGGTTAALDLFNTVLERAWTAGAFDQTGIPASALGMSTEEIEAAFGGGEPPTMSLTFLLPPVLQRASGGSFRVGVGDAEVTVTSGEDLPASGHTSLVAVAQPGLDAGGALDLEVGETRRFETSLGRSALQPVALSAAVETLLRHALDRGIAASVAEVTAPTP
ncbi:MAG TPA: hypothetical protein RMF84_10060 [Polyangiaceae bacterium LLY-WYZ-14_1]|nr:hypothetical protein [Polyangiaceae bacterium LLY-WYZ-14_1]